MYGFGAVCATSARKATASVYCSANQMVRAHGVPGAPTGVMVSSSASRIAGPHDLEVRDRIFTSALRHFSQKGYAATSLREIADDAQTTKPMIYYYFGSKEGLYGNIVRQILEDMANAIRGQLDPAQPFTEQVITYCARYMDYFMAQEEIIALVLREVFGLGGASMDTFARTLGAEVRRPLDEILEQGIERGDFRSNDVAGCAVAITGIMNMFILAHVFGGAPIERDRPLGQVRYYVDGLRRA
jgi:TetR/AcrR family transcriptional regulator